MGRSHPFYQSPKCRIPSFGSAECWDSFSGDDPFLGFALVDCVTLGFGCLLTVQLVTQDDMVHVKSQKLDRAAAQLAAHNILLHIILSYFILTGNLCKWEIVSGNSNLSPSTNTSILLQVRTMVKNVRAGGDLFVQKRWIVDCQHL